jgi:hypothetical protein
MTQSMKSCGSCTFCCKVMGIAELAKPQGVWCPHCRPGRGCGIYGAHPPSCQSFACQWLSEPGMPDIYKPDRSKVVLDTDPGGPRLIALCDPAAPVAWREEPMYSLLKGQAREKWGSPMMVLAKAGLRMWLITPKEDIDLGLVDPRSPLDVQQRPDGSAVVKVLPPVPAGEGQPVTRPG